jgi:hypothetical protein
MAALNTSSTASAAMAPIRAEPLHKSKHPMLSSAAGNKKLNGFRRNAGTPKSPSALRESANPPSSLLRPATRNSTERRSLEEKSASDIIHSHHLKLPKQIPQGDFNWKGGRWTIAQQKQLTLKGRYVKANYQNGAQFVEGRLRHVPIRITCCEYGQPLVSDR